MTLALQLCNMLCIPFLRLAHQQFFNFLLHKVLWFKGTFNSEMQIQIDRILIHIIRGHFVFVMAHFTGGTVILLSDSAIQIVLVPQWLHSQLRQFIGCFGRMFLKNIKCCLCISVLSVLQNSVCNMCYLLLSLMQSNINSRST